MYILKETKIFRKKLLKIDDKIFQKFFPILERIEKGPPFEKKYNVHILNGKYNKYYSINLTGDFRIIFDIDNQNKIIHLLDIGSHSQLYG
ncbi:MAG: type II toxin-antitoxin system mRNA interferase toxin, RelE/StbE family [Candidatus Gracilibacteria bacterium]|nr:type II toxin-antitoxin system mRNA interferase toxin, RelE/StbE family [Candidatus Gracilibacteria bacterium]